MPVPGERPEPSAERRDVERGLVRRGHGLPFDGAVRPERPRDGRSVGDLSVARRGALRVPVKHVRCATATRPHPPAAAQGSLARSLRPGPGASEKRRSDAAGVVRAGCWSRRRRRRPPSRGERPAARLPGAARASADLAPAACLACRASSTPRAWGASPGIRRASHPMSSSPADRALSGMAGSWSRHEMSLMSRVRAPSSATRKSAGDAARLRRALLEAPVLGRAAAGIRGSLGLIAEPSCAIRRPSPPRDSPSV